MLFSILSPSVCIAVLALCPRQLLILCAVQTHWLLLITISATMPVATAVMAAMIPTAVAEQIFIIFTPLNNDAVHIVPRKE